LFCHIYAPVAIGEVQKFHEENWEQKKTGQVMTVRKLSFTPPGLFSRRVATLSSVKSTKNFSK